LKVLDCILETLKIIQYTDKVVTTQYVCVCVCIYISISIYIYIYIRLYFNFFAHLMDDLN